MNVDLKLKKPRVYKDPGTSYWVGEHPTGHRVFEPRWELALWWALHYLEIHERWAQHAHHLEPCS